jgi:L-alanine-DL-glutamate epimerase-like enolase superfamily enzyme
MHEEVDWDLDFRLDPNQGWRLDEAVRVCAQLEDAGIYLEYVEQPIRTDSPKSLVCLRQRTNQPIGINEDTYVPHNLQQSATEGTVDVAVLDLAPLGGIAGPRQSVGVAEEANIPITHHCAFDLGIRTAAILHAVSNLPGSSLPIDTAYYAWEDDVLTDRFEIKDGVITVPTGPGLGVKVDRDKLSEYHTPSV